MLRSDREIKDFNEIIDVLRRCAAIRLGLNGGEFPYVVPLSFGYEVVDKNISIYFHGAKKGFKHELLAKNDKVCVEASIIHRFVEVSVLNSITAEYESFIGFGSAKVVSGADAVKGLNLICEQAGFKNYDFGGEKVLGVTKVYKIEINKFSCKKCFI